jgi:hypothetical protein
MWVTSLPQSVSNPKTNFFRYAEGEEPQNDFFVSLLSWGDVQKVLNTIHDEDNIEFDESAKIIGTQRDGLPHHPPENDIKRTLDWVVKDSTKLVGYESKCGDDLTGKQLREERRKLEYNANGRDVNLFAFTEGIREPKVEADFSWKSWSKVGKKVISLEEKSKTTEMMADMFRDMGYEGFTGFTEYEQSEQWHVIHQNEAVDLVLEATERAEGLRLYDRGQSHIDHHNRVQTNIHHVKNKDYRGLAPPYYVFSVHPIGYRDKETEYDISNKSWYIALVIPALHNEVYVQMNTYPSKYESARQDMQEYAKEIARIVAAHEMHVDASWNSLIKEVEPTRYREPEEIANILKNKAGENSWKRLRFGWDLEMDKKPDDMIEEAARKMEKLHDIFYDGIERRTDFSVVNEPSPRSST